MICEVSKNCFPFPELLGLHSFTLAAANYYGSHLKKKGSQEL
jgi:hypothetical protein